MKFNTIYFLKIPASTDVPWRRGFIAVSHLIVKKSREMPKGKEVYLVVDESMINESRDESAGGYFKSKYPFANLEG
jgi:hypothetical protein